ncbi:MAG: delta-lactam-biosynthetic de-N-acetylase [Bacillota bacterium]
MKKGKIAAAVILSAALTLGTGVLMLNNNAQEQPTQQPAVRTETNQLPANPPVSQDTAAEQDEKKPENTPPNQGQTQTNPNADDQSGSSVQTGANEKMGWYYKPNKEHKLPEVNPKGKALLQKYNGIYHGYTGGKNIYLTFDEGYENGYTPKILDTLKQNNVKAAFFITGDYLRRHPDLVKRMVNEGHIVGNHTDNHPSLPQVSDAMVQKEIQTLSEDFAKLTGGKMTYLRPPMGEYSERTLKISHEMGYRNVFWSVALVDWRPDAGSPEQNKNTVMERLHDGAVILLHAVNKANADMLADLIQECKEKGYQFKSLDEI